MKKLLKVVVLGAFFAGSAWAGECGKDVMGGCETASNNGVAMHMESNAVLNAQLRAKRAADEAEAMKMAARLLAESNAQEKAALEAKKNRSIVEKVMDKLGAN